MACLGEGCGWRRRHRRAHNPAAGSSDVGPGGGSLVPGGGPGRASSSHIAAWGKASRLRQGLAAGSMVNEAGAGGGRSVNGCGAGAGGGGQHGALQRPPRPLDRRRPHTPSDARARTRARSRGASAWHRLCELGWVVRDRVGKRVWWQASGCVAAGKRFCAGRRAVVLWQASESVVAVLIDDGAHHLDLFFRHPPPVPVPPQPGGPRAEGVACQPTPAGVSAPDALEPGTGACLMPLTQSSELPW